MLGLALGLGQPYLLHVPALSEESDLSVSIDCFSFRSS